MFSLLRERKGTVCRAGLDRRVQSKCLVAELLSREQKVAHIVVVSFPLHQIKTFFFFCFSGRPGPQLLNPCRRVKMRRLQLQVKKKRTKSTKKKKRIWCFSSRHLETPAATDRTKSGVFVVEDKQSRVVNCQASSTPNLSHSGFKGRRLHKSERLMKSSRSLGSLVRL